MSRGLETFAELFTAEQKNGIEKAPFYWGQRHPSWAPLFGEDTSLHARHYRLDQSVKLIAGHADGEWWMKSKIANLLDQKEVNNASAAMAEIRMFGGLIEAGFDVEAVREKAGTTPDFIARTGSQVVVVEVAAKHQDREQDELGEGIHDAMRGDGPVPEGVGYSERRRRGGGMLRMAESVHQPGGSPDPSKPEDSVQANVIQRVCGVKGKERQIADGMAAILVIDFNDFGGPLIPLGMIDQTAPAIRWTDGFTSGALWYAFYGWKGAPVFEGDECVTMGHDGRFRMAGDKKSKLSAALLVMPEHVVCFEHPTAEYPLEEDTRLAITRLPWFDQHHSIMEWNRGDVERQVELHRGMIDRLEARFEEIRWG